MAAMFTRNKMIGWSAVMLAVQKYLSDSPGQKSDGTPGYMTLGMAIMSLGVTYLNLILPPPPLRNLAGSGTEAPAATPPL
ncbi:MAG: hypothetical protein M1829_000931 [Trizodia sp. TS-e1964]|nr:MAG: hypothetical protein M1829_000931 [Trizodia sp. TS-e1964]